MRTMSTSLALNPPVTRVDGRELGQIAMGYEHPPRGAQYQRVTEKRGTESDTVGPDSKFGDAVEALMRLPLSAEEKAEAVRRVA